MRNGVNVWIVFFTLLSLLILFAGKTLFISNFSGFFQTVFQTPKSMLYSLNIKLSNPFNVFGPDDYEKLRKENSDILSRFVDYARMKKDNEVLKAQFESGSFESSKLISAHVIGYLGRHDFPSGLIIDRGEQNGVRNGAGVIIGKNLVGKIGKASKSYSRVILPNDKQFTIVGKTLSNSTTGLVMGEDDFILFGNVVITDELKKDDTVITKGEVNENGVGVPPDILIGKISTINKAENRPFQDAKIEPMLNYANLETVFVVKQLE